MIDKVTPLSHQGRGVGGEGELEIHLILVMLNLILTFLEIEKIIINED